MVIGDGESDSAIIFGLACSGKKSIFQNVLKILISGHSKYCKLFSGAFSDEGAIELRDLRPRLPYNGPII